MRRERGRVLLRVESAQQRAAPGHHRVIDAQAANDDLDGLQALYSSTCSDQHADASHCWKAREGRLGRVSRLVTRVR